MTCRGLIYQAHLFLQKDSEWIKEQMLHCRGLIYQAHLF
jgi:hypothetical protein